MATEEHTPRSRRALLAAAAGAAGALAATAAMPLAAAAADPNDVVKGVDNPTTATTTISDSAEGSTAFAARSLGTLPAFGAVGSSFTAAGLLGWSRTSPDPSWFKREYTDYVGVFGSAPSNPDPEVGAAGVWGDSPDNGVFGSGGRGVVGYGYIGVEGDANTFAGAVGVWAWAPSTSQVALKVTGKVSLSRSGRQSMASGTASRSVTLGGVTTTSKVFAVLATGEPGRWVRSVIPGDGKFTIYLNTSLTSSAVVSWFVLD